jgi:Tol biopolymer transport system component
VSSARGTGAAHVVVLAALVACVPSQGAAAIARLTDHGGEDCFIASPAFDAAGTRVAFESTCDLAGLNADRNREIFQADRAGAVVQLTNTTDCTSSAPSSSASGDVVAFDSDCDTGGNADRNVEIFVVQNAMVAQLTTSSDCTNLSPSINAAGTLVSFDSDCDFNLTNFDRSVEVFRADRGGAIQQLSDDDSLTGCASFNATSDGTGSKVAFESDCDLLGTNSSQLGEIFLADTTGLSQLTASQDDVCTKTRADLSSDGQTVAFTSDCDLTGQNSDASTEVFAVRNGQFTQVSRDSGQTGCESFDVAVTRGAFGQRVVFTSYCDLNAQNSDRSLEVFRAAGGVVSQLSSGAASCWSASPAISADGSSVAFVSNCDIGGLNPDGSNELFVMDACVCGAPVSHAEPTASDALFSLKAAIGSVQCAPCDCDVNDDASVTASDALLILKKAVGQAVELRCE